MLRRPAAMHGWRTLGLSLRGRVCCGEPMPAAAKASSAAGPAATLSPGAKAAVPSRIARCYALKREYGWVSQERRAPSFPSNGPSSWWPAPRGQRRGAAGQAAGPDVQGTDEIQQGQASSPGSEASCEPLPEAVQGMVRHTREAISFAIAVAITRVTGPVTLHVLIGVAITQGILQPQLIGATYETNGHVITAKANYVQVEVGTQWRGTVPHPLLLCNVKTLLKKMKQRVLVGDQVVVESIDWQDGRGFVGKVLPRSSELADPTIANIDHVLLVFAADEPPFDVTQVTRFLVGSEVHDVPITVVLNKCDLLSPAEVQMRMEQLKEWGYAAVPISVHASIGLEELSETMKDRMTVLAGPSGVGKSSVINYLRTTSTRLGSPEAVRNANSVLEEDLQRAEEQRVGTVGKTGRGRHTTRHTTLLMLPNGGIVADTPGFNQPSLDSLTPEDVSSCFPEIRERLRGGERCTFNDCRHLEEPGCVVRGDWERYPLYADLLLEVEEKDALLRERARSKQMRQGRVRYKSGSGGEARAEVLLDSKKHRRASRKQTKQKFSQEILGGDYTGYD